MMSIQTKLSRIATAVNTIRSLRAQLDDWSKRLEGDDEAASGETKADNILSQVRQTITSTPDTRLDYAVLVDPETLHGVDTIKGAARLAVAAGFEVMTGAGGGVMEGANSGAGCDHSIGLNVDLPFEQHPNPFVSGCEGRLLYFRYFFTRKLFFLQESDALVVMPGGFGTLDELAEIVRRAGLGAAKRVEHVVRDLGGTQQRAGQDVTDRHAVLQRQEADHRLQHLGPTRLVHQQEVAVAQRGSAVDQRRQLSGYAGRGSRSGEEVRPDYSRQQTRCRLPGGAGSDHLRPGHGQAFELRESMKKKLYLHIGMGKTGTTALQDFFWPSISTVTEPPGWSDEDLEGRYTLQGNLDPSVLLAQPEVIRKEAERTLASFGAGEGHVFNLGHGITPDADPPAEIHLMEPLGADVALELPELTRAMAQGDLEQQVVVRSQDELGELAAAFNQMSAELARANEARRQMTADIAHDLRTPLSVILGYTEALADGKLQGSPQMYEVMHGEAQHLNHLVDDLRFLSLADAGELPCKVLVVVERHNAVYRAHAIGRLLPCPVHRFRVHPSGGRQGVGDPLEARYRRLQQVQAARRHVALELDGLARADDAVGAHREPQFIEAVALQQRMGEPDLRFGVADEAVDEGSDQAKKTAETHDCCLPMGAG